jgi:hypothetical protein
VKNGPSPESAAALFTDTRQVLRTLRQAMGDPALSGGCFLLAELFDVLATDPAAEALLVYPLASRNLDRCCGFPTTPWCRSDRIPPRRLRGVRCPRIWPTATPRNCSAWFR